MNRRTFIESCGILFGMSYLSGCRSNENNTSPEADGMLLPNAEVTPRVYRVSDPKATTWDYQHGPYINAIDSVTVYEMIKTGLQSICGTNSLKSAWRKILNGYESPQKIVIKPNLNNTLIGYEKAIMTSPQVIDGVVRSLIEADISAKNITLFDLTAKPMPSISSIIETYGINAVWRRDADTVWEKLALRLNMGEDAPDTRFPIALRRPVTLENGDPLICYMPKVLTNAHHLINLPVFKAHQFIVHSNALKNHFGTVRYSNHLQYPVLLHGNDIQSHIVDINAHPIIAGRTRLVIADALFGAGLFTREGNDRIPMPWQTFPGGATPNSLFFSQDPVAIESVVSDYIIAEQRRAGIAPFAETYLKDAAERGLGTYERRDSEGNYSSIVYSQIDLQNNSSQNKQG